ncbi:MAG: hypothetical protein MZW92_76340 [Comamonadaceae bacterium]|nr:hypothetical protein [Comamonadaceae bacterium]
MPLALTARPRRPPQRLPPPIGQRRRSRPGGASTWRACCPPASRSVRAKCAKAGGVVSGSEAACVLCHRRTGLGSYEGSVIVPPVIGQALFGKFRKPGDRCRGAPPA